MIKKVKNYLLFIKVKENNSYLIVLKFVKKKKNI
jgi:hypothetical protein